MKPDTTMGTAHGNIVKDLKRLDPLEILEREWAKIMLMTKVKRVTPEQKTRVFLKLSQKTLSCRIFK
jgi:hypothetical protein